MRNYFLFVGFTAISLISVSFLAQHFNPGSTNPATLQQCLGTIFAIAFLVSAGIFAEMATGATKIPDEQADKKNLQHGIASIKNNDPNFDIKRISYLVIDAFLQIQYAITHRNTDNVRHLVADGVHATLMEYIGDLLREKTINRLENISISSVELLQAWQVDGTDHLTLLITGKMIDYTIYEINPEIILEGSNTEVANFEEIWTLRRESFGSWKLAEINN